jgi:hypothetical protein
MFVKYHPSLGEINMKELNIKDLHEVSGGDVALSFTANVPTANEAALAGLVGQLLVGTLDAAALSAALAADPTDFNAMAIQTITVGNFTITNNG